MVSQKYGPPETMELREIAAPTPGEAEVLIKVAAASVNAWDWHLLMADPFLVRIGGMGFFRPKFKVLGADLAGTVTAVGKGVTAFAEGDEVYGSVSDTGGAFAEYACARPAMITRKPEHITFAEAAAVPMAALTALQGLRDVGEIRAGERVLVNGASGGVGTFAVQIAKAFDTEVTAVCSGPKVGLLRLLGVDEVIDYTTTDFTRQGILYDLIFDGAGTVTLSGADHALADGGRCAVAGFSSMGSMLRTALFGRRLSKKSGKKMAMVSEKPNAADLEIMNDLMAAGKVKPIVEKAFPLEEAGAALRHLYEGRARGKVVVLVSESS